MREASRILVVEDEKKLAFALKEGLEADHYFVSVAHSGTDGFVLAHGQSFDLLILDLMLPGPDGLEILRSFRQHHFDTPVLLLTAKDTMNYWRVSASCCGAVTATSILRVRCDWLTWKWMSSITQWPVAGGN